MDQATKNAGLRVAVVSGGPSAEAEVSRSSGRAVRDALREAGHVPELLELGPELAQMLVTGGFDVAFPAVHGPLGEDGCLQGLLEVVGLPYVGAGVLASARAASKPAAKQAFREAGLPLAAEAIVRGEADLAAAARHVRRTLGRRVVVKPSGGGSAIGVTRVDENATDEELVAALETALAAAGEPEVLVEAWISGLEVTCGVLELGGSRRALPPTLIEAQAAEWYDFKSRYGTGGSRHICPAPFSVRRIERIQEVALAAFAAVGARDLGRMDFVVPEDEAEELVLLEVNTLPGMTATSLFPEAAQVAGVSFPELCGGLAAQAAQRPGRQLPAALAMPE